LTTLIDCHLVLTFHVVDIKCDLRGTRNNNVSRDLGRCDTLRLFHTEECGFAGASVHPGDYTHKETHVPIPNTTVKLAGPMIVHTSAKVGYCREHFLKARS
jgi:hypothetical protein